MDQNELNRAISSIQKKDDGSSSPKLAHTIGASAGGLKTIIAGSNTHIKRIPGITTTTTATPTPTSIQVQPPPPMYIVAAESQPTTAVQNQIVQSVVVPSSKTTFAQQGAAGQTQNRVVVERIGEALKFVQPIPIKEPVIINSPTLQRFAMPKNVKIISATAAATSATVGSPNRFVLATHPQIRTVAAPKPVTTVLIPKTMGKVPVQVTTKKVEVVPEPSSARMDKIVIIQKPAVADTQIKVLPGPSTVAGATNTTPTAPKSLSGEQRLDQLMKNLVEGEGKLKITQKEDFTSKQNQLIANLKLKHNITAPPALVRKDVASPRTALTIRGPVSHARPTLLWKNKTGGVVAGIRAGAPGTLRHRAPVPATAISRVPDAKRVQVLRETTIVACPKTATPSPPPQPPPEGITSPTKVVRPEDKLGKIEIQISDGMLSDPNGPIKVIVPSSDNEPKISQTSPRTIRRSLSMVDKPDPPEETTKRSARSLSMTETPVKKAAAAAVTEKPTEIYTVVTEENLLCDENIDQVSPTKPEPQKAPRTKQNKRKTAHKTLEDDKNEPVVTEIKIEDDEDEEVDIISYENKLCRQKWSPTRGIKRENEGSDEENVGPNVLNVAVGKIFEYGAEPDDIYLTDPFRYIKWKEGIGRLRNSSVHFKLNEYGVYEVMSNEEYYQCKRVRADRALEMSINCRGSRKRRPPNDPVYTCRTCGETGIAEEFIQPDFCSWQCYDCTAEVKKLRAIDEGKTEKENDEDEMDSTPTTTSDSDDDEELLDESWIKETDAPLNLFRDAIPKGKNNFHVGMKLEAIDPFNQGLFCVCTVVDKRGFRLKLRFDGYSAEYDLWTYANSKQIFPPGWCAATGRTIEPPAQWPAGKNFNWNEYLKEPKVMAPVPLFRHLKDEASEQWTIGRKLEVDIPRAEGDGVTAATVKDIIGNRILVQLDFYKTEFWVDTDSPQIHPIDWHREMKQTFNSPVKDFCWSTYLRNERCKKIPDDAFNPRPPLAFRPGMKLEVVDPKNPSLIRPATVSQALEYRIRILFDGWPAQYTFWIADDSPDLHPVGYSKLTKHPLEPIISSDKAAEVCQTFRGCLGIGNARNKTRPFHRAQEECPYSKQNWAKTESSDRLAPVQKVKRTWKRSKPPATTISANSTTQRTSNSPPESIAAMGHDTETEEQETFLSRSKVNAKDAAKLREQLWQLNSKGLPKPDESQIYTWTPEQVAELVRQIPGCGTHARAFEHDQIDGSAFVTLTKEDLTGYLGLKYGPALKIYNRVLKLRELVLQDLSR